MAQAFTIYISLKRSRESLIRTGFTSQSKTFDRTTGFKKDYVESHTARKAHTKEPGKFFAKVMRLPTKEKNTAFKPLKTMGVMAPSTPANKVQMAAKNQSPWKE